jgi:hypothetical protein
MMNLLITSYNKQEADQQRCFELDAPLLSEIAGGLADCRLTSVRNPDGTWSEPVLDSN